MTINIMDLIAYIVFMFVIYFILPESAKKELGGVVGASVMILFTIIYIILFVFIDYDMYDLLVKLFIKLETDVKIKL